MSNVIDADLARRLLIPFVDDSGGVYAPTLRRIRGKYVIACTIARHQWIVSAIAEGWLHRKPSWMRSHAAEGNFILEVGFYRRAMAWAVLD